MSFHTPSSCLPRPYTIQYIVLTQSLARTVSIYIWISMFLANLIGKRHISLQVNSLWPNDAIWRHRTCSTLAQVMACCLTAPSHYLNQCWLIISKVQWHSSGSHFTRDTLDINHWNQFENYLSKLLFNSPRGQWVKPSANISFIWWTQIGMGPIRSMNWPQLPPLHFLLEKHWLSLNQTNQMHWFSAFSVVHFCDDYI